MRGNEPAVGDKVHHEGRMHPTRKGWMQANGEIFRIIFEDDDDEERTIAEVVVQFGEDDYAVYFTESLEWTNTLGGYWMVV